MFPSGEGSSSTPPPPISSSSSLKYPPSSSLVSGSYLSSYGSYYHHVQDPYNSTATQHSGGSAPLYHPHPTTENMPATQWYSSSAPHFGHPFYSPDWTCHHPGSNAPFLPESESQAQAYGSLMSHAASSQSAPGQSPYFRPCPRKGILEEEGEADEEPEEEEEEEEKSLFESHSAGDGIHQQQTTGGTSPHSKGKGGPFEWISNSSKRGIKSSSLSNSSVPHGKEGLGRTRTKDKYRVVYSDHQRLELEKEFHYSRYITIRRKAELATGLGLTERQVKIWFQNRRAKERKQLKKRDEIVSKEARGGSGGGPLPGPNRGPLPEGGLHHSMAAAAVAAFNPAAVMLSHRHHAHLSSSIGSPPNS